MYSAGKFEQLRLDALTLGEPFDETKFQAYAQSVGEERSFQKAYQKIMEHTLANVSDLAEQYRAAGMPHRRLGVQTLCGPYGELPSGVKDARGILRHSLL